MASALRCDVGDSDVSSYQHLNISSNEASGYTQVIRVISSTSDDYFIPISDEDSLSNSGYLAPLNDASRVVTATANVHHNSSTDDYDYPTVEPEYSNGSESLTADTNVDIRLCSTRISRKQINIVYSEPANANFIEEENGGISTYNEPDESQEPYNELGAFDNINQPDAKLPALQSLTRYGLSTIVL